MQSPRIDDVPYRSTMLMAGPLPRVALLLLLIAGVAEAQTTRGRANTPAAPTRPTTPRTQNPGRIGDITVAKVLEASQLGTPSDFLGIWRSLEGELVLSVSSNRQQIAFNAAKAAQSGGRYSPPETFRTDIVTVTCGNSDLRGFDCSRVAIRRSDGRPLRPLSYRAGPRPFRNALGSQWSRIMVDATYPSGELDSGFTVTYADPVGTEWSFEVSPYEAVAELLLDSIDTPGAPFLDDRATGPPDFQVEGSVNGGWRITNTGLDRWRRCQATLGNSMAKLGVIEGGGFVLLGASEFTPPVGANPSMPTISCAARGTTYVVAPKQ